MKNEQPSWAGLIESIVIGVIIGICGLILIYLSGCSLDQEPSSVSGADSEKISFPAFPTLPIPPVAVTTTKDKPTTTTTPTTESTSPASTGTTEQCRYAGRFNSDRATWYCGKKMSQYPAKLTIIIPGCITKEISNNGTRYESGGLIVKQSEVSGRGMAIVMASSCKSTSASIRY